MTSIGLNGVCSPSNTAPSTPCTGGICNGAGQCVQCVNDAHCSPPPSECLIAVCTNGGVCGVAFKPKGEYCNVFADQCDGMGNCVDCVDCVDSGGCAECCVCNNGMCVPTQKRTPA